MGTDVFHGLVCMLMDSFADGFNAYRDLFRDNEHCRHDANRDGDRSPSGPIPNLFILGGFNLSQNPSVPNLLPAHPREREIYKSGPWCTRLCPNNCSSLLSKINQPFHLDNSVQLGLHSSVGNHGVTLAHE